MPLPSPPTTSLSAPELLKAMVRFPTLSHEEGPLADYLVAYLTGLGLPVGRHEDNIYAWIGTGGDVLLLNSHLDVVPPSADHPYDPFEPTEVGGLLYGRGTVDAKASGASMLTALVGLHEQGWEPPEDGRLMVALTVCEEVGADVNGLERTRPFLPPIKAALVGEPTEMQPCVAQGGLLILRVEARGRTAHAARAHLGENALYKAMRDLQRIHDFRFERADPFLGELRVTPTVIEGGTARNVVPDRCTFYLDIRTNPAYTHDEIIVRMRELLESDVHVHSQRLIPVSTDTEARIVQACLRALPDAEPFGSPTMSDWLFLADVPTVKIGPGPSERSHTADEHIALADVERAVDGYQAIIRSYFADTE